jgi:hypothetical protein
VLEQGAGAKETVSQPVSPLRGSDFFPLEPRVYTRG